MAGSLRNEKESGKREGWETRRPGIVPSERRSTTGKDASAAP